MAYKLLFLCTFNAGRSILAEAILNSKHEAAFIGYSAGEDPRQAPHPQALACLRGHGINTAGLRSKHWREFLRAKNEIDCVITLCNNADGEICPSLPGRPAVAHWNIIDPGDATNDAEREQMFEQAFQMLNRTITDLVDLPAGLRPQDLARRITAIGWSSGLQAA